MMTAPNFKECVNCGKEIQYVRVHAVIVGLKDQLTITLLVDKLATKQLTA